MDSVDEALSGLHHRSVSFVLHSFSQISRSGSKFTVFKGLSRFPPFRLKGNIKSSLLCLHDQAFRPDKLNNGIHPKRDRAVSSLQQSSIATTDKASAEDYQMQLEKQGGFEQSPLSGGR